MEKKKKKKKKKEKKEKEKKEKKEKIFTIKYSLNRLCSNWLKFQFDQRKKNFSSRKG